MFIPWPRSRYLLTDISETRLDRLLQCMSGKTIAVVGDLMLDRYIWGRVNRISPEAPVVVVEAEDEQSRLGGAANVAKNVKSLGGHPFLLGVVGADTSGNQLLEAVKASGFSDEGIITDSTRPTTVKTRIIAHGQHVVRIDRESAAPITTGVRQAIIDRLLLHLPHIDGIIIEDYNKGVIVRELLTEVISIARSNDRVVTVDPKFHNFFEYKNVTVFKPNRKEVEEVLGVKLDTDEDVELAGAKILSMLNAENVLLTRGEHGMTLFEKDGSISHVPTKARTIADVSGAGDTVIATLTLALVGGANVREASAMANFAGGTVCGYIGIVPIEKDELRKSMMSDGISSASDGLA